MPIKLVFDGYRLKPKPSYQIFLKCLAIFLMATVVNYFLMLIKLFLMRHPTCSLYLIPTISAKYRSLICDVFFKVQEVSRIRADVG